jgi:hypothetical protein
VSLHGFHPSAARPAPLLDPPCYVADER